MSCPRLDEVVDHAEDLAAVPGLSGHAANCGECSLALRVLEEVEDIRKTAVPSYLAERAMAGIEARRTKGVRARPWEIGWAALLGGLTVPTAAVAAGRLGAEGTALPLAVLSAAAAVAAAWREYRTLEVQ